MNHSTDLENAHALAGQLVQLLRSQEVQNTPSLRAVRRRYSQALMSASPAFMLELARELVAGNEFRWIAYELIRAHREAFGSLGEGDLEALGQGINSWWTVDSFARTLAGPAWLRGQVSDELILRWAGSDDRWWRRAALVSTVAWNVRSQGGPGDVPRTLAICRWLASDQDQMVAQALSWALRELVVHDTLAVRNFLDEFEPVLAAQVKREVRNKLTSGLKNPRSRS